jgi:IS5 family transposase
MKVYAGVDKDSGLIHSVVVTTANVHDLTPAAELLHGDEKVVYGDAGYQGIAKRPEMAGKTTEFRVAMRPGKRRVLPDTPEGRLQDLIETVKVHIRSKGEHPFRVIKQQFGLQKTRLRGLAKNRCKINVLAALSNLFQARRQFSQQPGRGLGVPEHLDSASKTSPEWLNMRPKVLRKRPQRQFTAKDTLP